MRSVYSKILTVILLLGGYTYAQQDPQFSMYMFNRQVLNPAFAGAMGSTNLTTAGRSQWVGIDGHPNTFSLSFNMPVQILKGGKDQKEYLKMYIKMKTKKNVQENNVTRKNPSGVFKKLI